MLDILHKFPHEPESTGVIVNKMQNLVHNMLLKRKKSSKRERRFLVIRSIIGTHKIRTQEELAEHLLKRGFDTTQSSLSRDIKKMGLMKREGYYQLPLMTRNGLITPPILSIHHTGHHLIVLKTLPSMAPTLGSTIDEIKIEGVLGTVAGDDTVFVATIDTVKVTTVANRLRKLFSQSRQNTL